MRLSGLDVMRSLAIAPVVLGHGWEMFVHFGTPIKRPFMPDGVDIFFVLSGFLIGEILMRMPQYDGNSVARFWGRRWLRTLPAYYIFLAINYLLAMAQLTWEDASLLDWRYFVFCQNWLSANVGFYWESWSLTIEEWFYLCFPLMVWGLTRLGMSRVGALGWAVAAMLLLPLAGRCYRGYGLLSDYGTWDTMFRKVTLLRMDAIGWGLLLAYVKAFKPELWRYWQGWRAVAVFAVTMLANGLMFGDYDDGFYMETFSFTLFAMSWASLLPFFYDYRPPRRIASFCNSLALVSYSMYLINLPLSLLLMRLMPVTKGDYVQSLSVFVLYLALTYVLSLWSYRLIEQPILRLRDKWLTSS